MSKISPKIRVIQMDGIRFMKKPPSEISTSSKRQQKALFPHEPTMKNSIVVLAIHLLLSGLAISGCSSLNVREIKALERIPFEPLRIQPEVEPNDLRVDVIRQTEQTTVGNSVRTTDVPYDPLGLNLGNGLFYDTNENFSLRLDYLLDFEGAEAFELRKTTTPTFDSGLTLYSLADDTVTISRPPGKKVRYQYHRTGSQDSRSFMRRGNLDYTIVQRDSALVQRNSRREIKGIYKQDDENFYLQRRRTKIDYRLADGEVYLRDRYILALTNQNKTLGIYRTTRKGKRLIQTIERSRDKILVYNSDFKGKKLEFTGDGVRVFRDKKLITQYDLESVKKERTEVGVP